MIYFCNCLFYLYTMQMVGNIIYIIKQGPISESQSWQRLVQRCIRPQQALRPLLGANSSHPIAFIYQDHIFSQSLMISQTCLGCRGDSAVLPRNGSMKVQFFLFVVFLVQYGRAQSKIYSFFYNFWLSNLTFCLNFTILQERYRIGLIVDIWLKWFVRYKTENKWKDFAFNYKI